MQLQTFLSTLYESVMQFEVRFLVLHAISQLLDLQYKEARKTKGEKKENYARYLSGSYFWDNIWQTAEKDDNNFRWDNRPDRDPFRRINLIRSRGS